MIFKTDTSVALSGMRVHAEISAALYAAWPSLGKKSGLRSTAAARVLA
jgi:hypothetical protein